MNIHKICIITGTRAEYGLLAPLMREIKKETDWAVQIIATGMHLSPEFGLTYHDIERDGFTISEKVEVLLSADSKLAVAKSTGLAVMGIADSLARLAPDLVVILGDRFEALGAATAAHILGIPIAHLHGGEVTEGAVDDAFRHAITKMSTLHFTSTETYRNRVIQLGEHPQRVFNVGAIGIDNILELPLLSRDELQANLRLTFQKTNLLITFHPETQASLEPTSALKILLDVLDKFEDISLFFTKANADSGGRSLNKMLDAFVQQNPHKAYAFDSLGQLRYLSLMRQVDAVVGNSSSGILETPTFKIPTINIGDRQKGRIRAPSILDCPCESRAIHSTLLNALSPDFRESLRTMESPYGNGGTAKRIVKIMKVWNPNCGNAKSFFDLP